MIRVSSIFTTMVIGSLTLYLLLYMALGVNKISSLMEALSLVGLLCAIPAIYISRSIYTNRPVIFFGLFCGYLLILAISTAITGNSGTSRIQALLVDGFVDIKIYSIAFFLVAFVPAYRNAQLVKTVFVVILCVGCLNMPFVFMDLVSTKSVHGLWLEKRFGLGIPVGLFDHKLKSAQFQLIAMIAAFGLLCDASKHRTLFKTLAGLMTVSVMAHLSVKEIAAMGAVLYLFLVMTYRGDMGVKSMIALSLFVVMTLAISFETPIQSAIFDRFSVFLGETGAKTVRTAAYIGSVHLAADHMPFGAGAATFMSKGARDLSYSPFYYELGIDKLYGGSEDDPRFIMDTFWPKIIGQTGVLGVLFYFSMIAISIFWGLRDFKREVSMPAFCAAMMLLSVFIFSLATPAYTHDHVTIPVAVSLALVLSRSSNKKGLNNAR